MSRVELAKKRQKIYNKLILELGYDTNKKILDINVEELFLSGVSSNEIGVIIGIKNNIKDLTSYLSAADYDKVTAK